MKLFINIRHCFIALRTAYSSVLSVVSPDNRLTVKCRYRTTNFYRRVFDASAEMAEIAPNSNNFTESSLENHVRTLSSQEENPNYTREKISFKFEACEKDHESHFQEERDCATSISFAFTDRSTLLTISCTLLEDHTSILKEINQLFLHKKQDANHKIRREEIRRSLFTLAKCASPGWYFLSCL